MGVAGVLKAMLPVTLGYESSIERTIPQRGSAPLLGAGHHPVRHVTGLVRVRVGPLPPQGGEEDCDREGRSDDADLAPHKLRVKVHSPREEDEEEARQVQRQRLDVVAGFVARPCMRVIYDAFCAFYILAKGGGGWLTFGEKGRRRAEQG